MQLLHDHPTLMAAVKDVSKLVALTKNSSGSFEVNKKRSSDGSLLQMNPVASGDNVATSLNSTHKLKEELPNLVPCCEGRDLQINEEVVRSGLSAISVRHDDSVVQCLSMSRACEQLQVSPGLMKHRNSFRSLHRPDLKRVPYLRRMSPDELEVLFRGYAADLASRVTAMSGNHDQYAAALPSDSYFQTKDLKQKEPTILDDDKATIALHPIPETRSAAEDVPTGCRLHGARARLYTSVLAGARAGDQINGTQASEEYDTHVPADCAVPEDEVQLAEELQIILPPRCDDVTAESSITTRSSDNASR